MFWTIARRVGQVLLLPIFAVGLFVGLLAALAIVLWRTGVVGYHAALRLTNTGE